MREDIIFWVCLFAVPIVVAIFAVIHSLVSLLAWAAG